MSPPIFFAWPLMTSTYAVPFTGVRILRCSSGDGGRGGGRGGTASFLAGACCGGFAGLGERGRARSAMRAEERSGTSTSRRNFI